MSSCFYGLFAKDLQFGNLCCIRKVCIPVFNNNKKKLVFIKGFQTKLDKVMSNIQFKFKPSPLMKSKQFQI